MKTIVLHSPALTNAGKYLDGGATVSVGDAADQIAIDRAADLVKTQRAIAPAVSKAAE